MPLEANPRISLNRVRKAMYNKMTTAKAKKTKPVDYVTNFDATVNILNQNYARQLRRGKVRSILGVSKQRFKKLLLQFKNNH